MPVISRFHGIVIKMYLSQSEHNPPHIHAACGEDAGLFSLPDGEMFEGDLGSREQKLVKKFIEKYGDRLLHMWETQEFEQLDPVD